MDQSSSEGIGNNPQPSENFGTIPNPSEPFRTVRNISERTETHTLTVREVARLFEQAGVTRTERSIINWCRLNRQGVARLDAFFDENEGRYYITPQSVTRAIEEERAKQSANGTATTTTINDSASGGEREIPKHSESTSRRGETDSDRSDHVKELVRQNRDLEITTRAKDYYIEQLTKERGQFHEQLLSLSQHVGELKTQLLQLGSDPHSENNFPSHSNIRKEQILHDSESVVSFRHTVFCVHCRPCEK